MHKKITKFVSFIGVVRSGHTLIASLLDAHSNIAVSVGQNPLLRFEQEDSREELFNRIFDYCRKNKKRNRGGYSYLIENSMQGVLKNVYVIGDSAATAENIRKFSDNKTLRKFCNFIEVPIYWLWMIRDPFENAHSGRKISGRHLDDVIKTHHKSYLRSYRFRKKHKNKVFVIYLEKFIENPKAGLIDLLDFIDIPYDDEYLDLCAKFVFSEPHKVFRRKTWSRKQMNRVNELIKKIPELAHYPLR